ncbi:MAG TPA: NADH-quinone oxidoreductase subunit J [Dehalococcoidia bacterium]|jgi:NADH-quinone oxidoreductase subunit J|nr:NADH-quinone oxidoreductase subunit J [Dehalococcoidia bacterium]
MDSTGVIIAFYVLAAMTIGSALAVVVVRNLIHAVIALIGTFAGLAGLYVTLSADFIAITQILIYIGAISILFLFAIVLTPRSGRGNQESFLRFPALVLALLVGTVLVYVAVDTQWNLSHAPDFPETASLIGELLLKTYVLPFEIASVLLLAAVLGSIILVRPEPVEED